MHASQSFEKEEIFRNMRDICVPGWWMMAYDSNDSPDIDWRRNKSLLLKVICKGLITALQIHHLWSRLTWYLLCTSWRSIFFIDVRFFSSIYIFKNLQLNYIEVFMFHPWSFASFSRYHCFLESKSSWFHRDPTVQSLFVWCATLNGYLELLNRFLSG